MTSIPKLLKLKDYITLTGTTLGIIALFCACIGTRDLISVGFFLVSLTLGTDLLDGYVARKTGTVNKIGIELDSLSDSLTFGITPAILTFQAFRTGGAYDIFLAIGAIGFALGAILRLARFNISIDDPGYTGVPTPLSAMLMISFFYANYFYSAASGDINAPFPYVSIYLIPLLMMLTGWFNITTYIRFGEKGKSVYIVFLIGLPLCPMLAFIAFISPGFLTSFVLSIFFLGVFVALLIYIIIGAFSRPEIKKEQKG